VTPAGADLFLGWDAAIWTLAAVSCLVAGVVRGFTGFGFALILVTAVSLLAPPAQIVPISLVLDIFAGLRLLPHVHRDIDRKGTLLMVLGALPAIPVGLYALTVVSDDHMRLGIGVLVLAAVTAIGLGLGLRRAPGTGLKLTTGVATGLLAGAAGIPGPPVILLYLSSPLPAAMLRATAVAVFLFTDAIALIGSGIAGLLSVELFWRCLILAPVVEIGVLIGRRGYGVARPEAVKRAALILLALLATVAIGRVLLAHLATS